ncbi:hypothetical protein OG379_39445 [Streptomyces sp. NBC_01166]|uniref:hypothetical protein n=1 Tax=Streptomyces sp. NBC_01166 TaxID=2903755 RepID=UPI0038645F49|nr:hypothetical protein OG379_39445 [Streptomyces sp. NBC_01166]
MVTIDRIGYYDQAEVETFWAAHQEAVGTALLGVSGRKSGAAHGRSPGEVVRCPQSALRPSRPPSSNCAVPVGTSGA